MTKHGAPDWYKYRTEAATHPIGDMAELAVRLGSIHYFDRRGDVIYMDNFEHGLGRWTLDEAGNGAAITISPSFYRTGGYSAKIESGTSPFSYASLRTFLPYPVLSRHGAECAFTLDSTANFIRWYLAIFTPTHNVRTCIKYTLSSGDLEYLDSTANYQTLTAGLNLDTRDGLFHTLKIVFDPTTREYIRVILDNTEHDLSGIACYLPAPAATTLLYFRLDLYGDTDTSAVIYLDDVIVTQDEP